MSDFFEEQFGPASTRFGEAGPATLAMAPAAAKRSRVEEAKPILKEKEDEGQLTVDVYQTDDDIVIRSTIAGVTAEDIDISLANDMVTIKGKRNPGEHVPEQDYYYQELYWGSFSRSIILPEDVDIEKATASMKNGILTVRLPKLAKSRMKKVKIST